MSARSFCGTKLPWHEQSFGLISWWDMNEFSAAVFVEIMSAVAQLARIYQAQKGDATILTPDSEASITIVQVLKSLTISLGDIGCRLSARASIRLINDLKTEMKSPAFYVRAQELSEIIKDEMNYHLFLWVPSHRAEWYSKNAEELLGAECCDHFKSIIPEVEEAMKCYATGRFTASAFHLMRATEAAVKALGKAIGLTPAHPGWKLVFDEVWKQYKNAVPRHASWTTHEDFLVTVSADLRAISKVWRNDIAHFVDTYTEEQAKPMFEIVSAFLRDAATKLDETGKLY